MNETSINPKVNAAAGGAVVAGAVTIIATWIVGLAYPEVEVPAEVQTAVTVVLTAAGAWIGGYLKRDNRDEGKHAVGYYGSDSDIG